MACWSTLRTSSVGVDRILLHLSLLSVSLCFLMFKNFMSNNITGTSTYKQPIEELAKTVEDLNEQRGEKVGNVFPI